MGKTSQVVIISFFTFKGFFNKLWAFRATGEAQISAKKVFNDDFFKIMGSGGKTGFSKMPNWGLYAILKDFETLSDAKSFLETNKIFNDFKHKSAENQIFILKPNSSHGLWDGRNPFIGKNEKTNGPIAVITRGRIKISKLWQFWRFVPPVSENIEIQDGLLFSIGIGELPLVQQATFSVWTSTEKMMEYAYKSKQHTEVIRKTRELSWYSEELFARFTILEEFKNLR
ncbi:MAG: hypothetical protein V4683_11705 [Bacteroidota bacterium]